MNVYISAALISAIISILLGKLTIPLLKKFRVGQPILGYVKEHKYKHGTPTMGGIFFIISATLTFAFFSSGDNYLAVNSIAVTVAFGIVGFIDDYIKIKLNRNEGLTPIQKILFQLALGVITSVSAYRSGITGVYIPFTSTLKEIGFFSVILNVFVFTATVNSVNLTDGLDGLCASVCIVYFIAIAVILNVEMQLNGRLYVNFKEYINLNVYAVSLAGALMGYLVFNTSKASVFMGDCGSLALGGAVSSISVFGSNTLYIPIIGITFVLSAISVLIQVAYYKKTKKRVFLMAPLHHHFQHKGYGEAKISYCYALLTAMISAVVIICVGR